MKQVISLIILCLLLEAGISNAQENPVYENRILSIPAVDSDIGAGSLQEVVIQLTEEGELRLMDYKESIEINSLNTVELIQTETLPVLVFLRVSGYQISGCDTRGRIVKRTVGNRIEVNMYYDNDWAIENPEVLCASAITNFTEIVNLDVFGFPQGDYEYSVNGRFLGSFTLANDNSL